MSSFSRRAFHLTGRVHRVVVLCCLVLSSVLLWVCALPEHVETPLAAQEPYHLGFISYKLRHILEVHRGGFVSAVTSSGPRPVVFHIVCDEISEKTWRLFFSGTLLFAQAGESLCLSSVRVNFYDIHRHLQSLVPLMRRARPLSSNWSIEMLALAILPLYVPEKVTRLVGIGMDGVFVDSLSWTDFFFERFADTQMIGIGKDVVVNAPNSGLVLWRADRIRKVKWLDMILRSTSRWGGNKEHIWPLFMFGGESAFLALMDMSVFWSLKKDHSSAFFELPFGLHLQMHGASKYNNFQGLVLLVHFSKDSRMDKSNESQAPWSWVMPAAKLATNIPLHQTKMRYCVKQIGY
jgi:hypothetical protein